MLLSYYVQNSVVGIILVSIVLFYVLGQGGRRQAQDSLFVALLFSTFAIILLELSVDLLSGKIFYGSRKLLTFATFWFYVVNPIPGALYLLYLDQLRRRWVRIPRGIGLIAFAPLAGAFILIVTSLFNGFIFSIDSNNVYQRGQGFYLIILADLLGLFMGFIYLVFYRNSFKEKDFSLLLFFPLPVLIGSALQILFYGMEVTGISLALTLVIVYLHMQNTQANKDYLTSLYNRSLCEQYFPSLLGRQKKDRAIGGILMDINDFKIINDSFGHELGDKSLRYFSRLLLDSFGSSWFIARYGGDEFILFKEGVTNGDLERDIVHFNEQLERFNSRGTLPFPLSVSYGCSLYEGSDSVDGDAFVKSLDTLMYEQKRLYHASHDRRK